MLNHGSEEVVAVAYQVLQPSIDSTTSPFANLCPLYVQSETERLSHKLEVVGSHMTCCMLSHREAKPKCGRVGHICCSLSYSFCLGGLWGGSLWGGSLWRGSLWLEVVSCSTTG